MKKISSYKDLIVWQRSMDLVESIYQETSEFPSAEQWGLISQMRRAAVSVPSNIAEGYGKQATGNYRQHLSIARGSLLELETQVLLARDWGICAQKKPPLCLLKSKKLAKC
jgi:four helix bundle protein